MRYRPEIDGLRAVAVLPVLLFHGGFEAFSGGYVGVDVFFVISGYLITGILIADLQKGDFSIARFYERRARRILPALFAVILTCLPFAWVWMPPLQLEAFAKSVVAVVFFASNILFWSEDGYFAAAAELKPLLHTWSLAVEEQFYLLFPIFLMLLWRFGRDNAFRIVMIVAMLSFLLSEWGWRNAPSANFYFATSRAWELLAGSVCAFWTVGKPQRASNTFSCIGLALIVFSILQYDKNTPFPSIYALVPVFGTMLIILFAGQGTWIARLFSAPPFVGVGLISYSAYLWHQPLFAFARLRSLTEPNAYFMGILVVVTLVLSYLTWRWIEQPFRRKTGPVLATRRRVFAASVGAGAVLAAFGLVGQLSNGFEGRFNGDLHRFNVASVERVSDSDACFLDQNDQISFDNALCAFRNDQQRFDVLLLGDSHMLALSGELGDALRARNVAYYHASYSGCPPFRNFRPFGAIRNRNCQGFSERAYEFAEQEDIGTVVLAARFPWYLDGARFDNREGGIEAGDNGWVDVLKQTRSVLNDPVRRRRVLENYEKEIRELAEHFKIVLVYPIPEAGWDVPSKAFKAERFGDGSREVTTSLAVYRNRTGEVNALFDRLVQDLPNVYGAPVFEALCSEEAGRCLNADANQIYYYDDDHLTNAGARLAAPVILGAIEAAIDR